LAFYFAAVYLRWLELGMSRSVVPGQLLHFASVSFISRLHILALLRGVSRTPQASSVKTIKVVVTMMQAVVHLQGQLKDIERCCGVPLELN
jgi:hypothetical protein